MEKQCLCLITVDFSQLKIDFHSNPAHFFVSMFNSLLHNFIIFPHPLRKSRFSEIPCLLQQIVLCLLFLHLEKSLQLLHTVKILWGWFSAEIILKQLRKEIITSTAQFIT